MFNRTNATIPAGTQVFSDDGQAVTFSKDIRVKATIIREDIEVTEFRYNGTDYTVDTDKVQWD